MGRALEDIKQAEPVMEAEATTAKPTIQLQISEDMEKRLVQIVIEDYRASQTARDARDYGNDSKGAKLNFEKWLKALRDIYNAQREPKDTPWKYCSNRSLRIATSILDMIHSRLFPAVVNEDLLRWRPGEVTDTPKAERISKFMHWWIWIRAKLRGFFDIWVKSSCGYGEVLTESYWNVDYIDRGRSVEEPVTDEAGQPLTNADGTPAIVKSRVIDRFEKSASKVYPPEDIFLQEGSCNIQKEPVILRDKFRYRELEEGEAEGRFVNITNMLKSMINWDKPEGMADPAEEEKLKAIKIRNTPVEVLKWYGNFDADGDGFAEDVRVMVSPEHELYLGGMAVKDLTKSGRRPLDYTKFDNRLNCPAENWGEGVLEKVKELAEEVDAIFNQMTDSNTLGILRPFFYDPGGDVDAPVLKLGPNKGTPISDPVRNIMFPDIRIETDQLILAIRLVLEFIERLTAASSYVLGKESEIVGGSGTATRTQAIVQAAEQRFAMPSERLREGAARIVTQHLDILQLNIPPGLETRVLGEDGQPLFQENELTADGIAGEFDAYILMDPSMGSKQTERELASMFYSVLLQNVLVGTDPVKIYKITADFLKAYGKDPEEYLGPAPTGDDIDDPADENTLIIQGDFARVRAQISENHLLHIKKHQELLDSPSLLLLQQTAPNLFMEVTTFIQQHIQEHMQMLQIMMSLMQKFGGSDGGAMGSGNGKEGGEGGDSGQGIQDSGSQGDGKPNRMETVSGPLAPAMQTKRNGQSGFPQSGQKF